MAPAARRATAGSTCRSEVVEAPFTEEAAGPAASAAGASAAASASALCAFAGAGSVFFLLATPPAERWRVNLGLLTGVPLLALIMVPRVPRKATWIGVFITLYPALCRRMRKDAPKPLAYGVGSVAGSILAVCSCTILPLAAGIWRMGAGIGPATAFLYAGPAINVLAYPHIARAFVDAVVDVMVAKCTLALETTGLTRLVVAGGVGANRQLRAGLDGQAASRGFDVYYPAPELCTDNGAMIAFAAALRLSGQHRPQDGAFSVRPRWDLASLQASLS
mgnify:CR=1 FL=1